MITDPLEEWRSLKEHYGRLSDEALQSRLEESSQLTDIAKETPRAEISSRGLRVQVGDTPPPVEDDFDTGLDLVVVKRLRDASEARQVNAFLNDSGIPCYFGRDNVESVDALPPDFEDGVDLKVCEADVARARGGLARVLTATPGTEAVSNFVCPRCKSPEIVFLGLDAEPKDPAVGATADSSFNWRCDACGHRWKDEGIEQQG
jgi:DNA-directed RNA polymerase subunit M/transcription elongation factor TFIIS